MRIKKFNEMFEIKGLQCDNCNWSDPNIPFSEYEENVNKPCPKCGENILSEKDFEMSKNIMGSDPLKGLASLMKGFDLDTSFNDDKIKSKLSKRKED